jgi:hypothetical protein
MVNPDCYDAWIRGSHIEFKFLINTFAVHVALRPLFNDPATVSQDLQDGANSAA